MLFVLLLNKKVCGNQNFIKPASSSTLLACKYLVAFHPAPAFFGWHSRYFVECVTIIKPLTFWGLAILQHPGAFLSCVLKIPLSRRLLLLPGFQSIRPGAVR